MKKIIIPITFRGHLPRQKLFLDELSKDFEVRLFQPVWIQGKDRSFGALDIAQQFHKTLKEDNYDCVIIRADRYELLMLAAISALEEIPIVHIEGGDVSKGVIDDKVRNAISQLSDYHFPTNEESKNRLIKMGIDPDKIFNYGSLDVEAAMAIEPKRLINEKYIFVPYHGIEGEDEKELERALCNFNNYVIIRVKGNSDYNKETQGQEYSPEDYVNLMKYAQCVVGNSSSILKELSVMGVGGVNVGDRQKGRLTPDNVINTPCQKDEIIKAIEKQIGIEYPICNVYYKENTSKNIANEIKNLI